MRNKHGIRNSLHAEHLWDNLVPTLWVLDQLRELIALPIHLTSIYRSPEYNAQLTGAAPQSYHMKNMAIDFQVSGMGPTEVTDILRDWRDDGVFKGGLKAYATFSHIDTRGYNADW